MAHRLHLPLSYTAGAPYNDLEFDWEWMNADYPDLLPIAEIPQSSSVGGFPAGTEGELHADETEEVGGDYTVGMPFTPGAGHYTWGHIQHYYATQSVGVTVDLSSVASMTPPPDGIVIPFASGFDLTGGEAHVFVDGDEVVGSAFVMSEAIPVPPVMFGYPSPDPHPRPLDLSSPEETAWFIWWGPKLGDTLPATISMEGSVTFESYRVFVEDGELPTPFIKADADAFAAAFETYVGTGLEPPDPEPLTRIYGVKLLDSDDGGGGDRLVRVMVV